jgi:formate dehydrogenase
MADFHLAVKPGTDAWCLAAIAAVVVQEGLAPMAWHAAHTEGFDEVAAVLREVPVAQYARRCGVDEPLIRAAARRIATAKSVSMLEDLGVQMNVHSTLNSYLNRLVWLLTGHYGRQGTNNAFVPLLSLSQSGRNATKQAPSNEPRPWAKSPVHGHKVIMGQADYVLPASSQFEKAEATFFNLEVPHNAFHLRAPVFAPRQCTLTEAEIHSRLVEALGAVGERQYRPLRRAARLGLRA